MVTDEQVRLLRSKRMDEKTQEAAAAAAGMSVRSARNWEEGPMPSEKKRPRDWRTRADPFASVWATEVVPLLERDEKGVLEAKTVIEVLGHRHEGQFKVGQARTLQRRMRDWRALHGPEKEVFFPQEHIAGREAAIDFTHCTELGVTVRGALLVHLLFEFVLSFSGWMWAELAFGETFEALVSGVQGAYWELGGVTEVVRSDNLSAATHELKQGGGRSLNRRFAAVLEHYGKLRSTRIQPGESHENGVVEQRHHRIKRAVAQALVVRGSSDFESIDAYEAFVREEVVAKRNRQVSPEKWALERAALRQLPSSKVPEYTSCPTMVRKWSTVRVRGRSYSVPSRLIGREVEARLYANVVEIRYGDKLVERMPRLRGESEAHVDYRHVIWSLVKKPGAFARYRYREQLFPTLTFRRAYDALREGRGDRAEVEYVRILHLAASTFEADVEAALAVLLEARAPFDYAAVRALVKPREATSFPAVAIPEPNLAAYDSLLVGGAV
jgi:hypothetical protein